MVAVLVDAHHAGGLLAVDKLAAPLHVLRFLIGSAVVVKPVILLPDEHDLHILLLKEDLQLFRKRQVQILFQHAVHAHLSRVVAAVARVDQNQAVFLCPGGSLLPETLPGKIKSGRQHQKRHGDPQLPAPSA